ncbi:hypothetical protein SISNIDRAFT_481154 [Sistotremastrum niveocremeum HHB9708]|uniref:Peptidase A22B, signal peptide peptidase n=1 Tax=Sistotremastrum niveocremeum HHB9708 TaxID=1314777 RepID=A0A165A2U4_9AGAM|nr:hypothetical protein SISNIDRAFT_481154 [Sistotremastrum niveocremeum HHB9708]
MSQVAATTEGLVAAYIGLLSLATFSIYTGSWSSLAKPPKVHGQKPNVDDDEDDQDNDEFDDRLSAADAYIFPIIGSVVLLGFYFLIKYFGTEIINYILGLYFTVAGIGSVWKSSLTILRYCMGTRWKAFSRYSFVLMKDSKNLSKVSFRIPSIVLFPVSAVPSAMYFWSTEAKKPALLTDILAMSFAHNALSLLRLDGFWTGCILLSGLFIYDIWWVFGTEVMVKVAVGLDAPMKILWPKSPYLSSDAGFAMLGLGDIVIPGTFVALALRYDLSRSGHRDYRRPFSKPYFTVAVVAYVVGLSTTMGVMHFFKAAQPALLPACIFSFIVTASIRGELKQAFEWTDSSSSLTITKSDEADSKDHEQPRSEGHADGVVKATAVESDKDSSVSRKEK